MLECDGAARHQGNQSGPALLVGLDLPLGLDLGGLQGEEGLVMRKRCRVASAGS